MLAKLHIPQADPGLRLRGGYRIWPEYLTRTPREREALMFVMLICTTLWGVFWVQFVVSMTVGIPAFYTFGGGNWYHPPMVFFAENSGPFPWSLAGTFVLLSFIAAALGNVGAWLWSSGVRGKWRMRFAVVVFSIMPCGWSVASYAARVGVADGLRAQIERERTIWQHAAIYQYGDGWVDDFELKRRRLEIERLEAMLEQWESELY